MVVLPLFVMVFFTSMMNEGQPSAMPIGIVDNDNTSTTRRMTRMIDAYQNSRVVAHYPSADAARHAMQRGELYGFMLFPRNMTSDLISGRQPTMSLYYTNTSLTAGALLYKEMKTACTLANAAVGQQVMAARGLSKEQTLAFLQPISIDTHMIGNPWVNYNIYLSAMLVPGMFLLFIFLMTAYTLGTEIKFGTQDRWLALADDNIYKAVAGKLLPHTLLYLAVMYAIMFYLFGVLHFPAPGGVGHIALLGMLVVVASQGFAVFVYGLIPSLRLSMSICSLWSVLSFSMVGSAFPVFAMDAPLQTLAWLFPLRHYYMVYSLCVFNDYPLSDVKWHIVTLVVFALLPMLVMRRMHKAIKNFDYEP